MRPPPPLCSMHVIFCVFTVILHVFKMWFCISLQSFLCLCKVIVIVLVVFLVFLVSLLLCWILLCPFLVILHLCGYFAYLFFLCLCNNIASLSSYIKNYSIISLKLIINFHFPSINIKTEAPLSCICCCSVVFFCAFYQFYTFLFVFSLIGLV